MKYLSTIATFAVVGHAQKTGTLSAQDAAGREITAVGFEFEAGQSFSAELNLKGSPVPLDTITLTTSTYGVESCTFAYKEGKDFFLAENLHMCDFPYREFGASFVGKLGLYEDDIKKIKVECLTTDFTVKKYKDCEPDTTNTIMSNNAEDLFTKQHPKWDLKKLRTKVAVYNWFWFLADILTYGGNPCLSTMIDGSVMNGLDYIMEDDLYRYAITGVYPMDKKHKKHKKKDDDEPKLEKKKGGDDSDDESDDDDDHHKGGKKGHGKHGKHGLDWRDRRDMKRFALVRAVDSGKEVFDGYNCVALSLKDFDWTNTFEWDTPYIYQAPSFSDVSSNYEATEDLYDLINAGTMTLNYIIDIIQTIIRKRDPFHMVTDLPQVLDAHMRAYFALGYQ